MLVVDQYALFFDIIFLLIAAVTILSSYNYLGKYVKAEGRVLRPLTLLCEPA